MPSEKNNNEINFDKEILLKEYELNMSDHDRKEKMAWLASTLYFTFCIAVIGFILGSENINNIFNTFCDQQKFIVFTIAYTIFIIIFICVFLFVNYQFNNKKRSYDKAMYLQKYFIKNQIENKNVKRFLFYKIYEFHKNYKHDKSVDIAREIIYFILWLFFIIKIAVMMIILLT